MKIEEQYSAFVKEYIRLDGKVNVEVLDKLYQFDCHSAYNFLRSFNKAAPDLKGYPKHIQRIAQLYFSLI